MYNFSTPMIGIWYTGDTMKKIIFLGVATFLLGAVPIYAQVKNSCSGKCMEWLAPQGMEAQICVNVATMPNAPLKCRWRNLKKRPISKAAQPAIKPPSFPNNFAWFYAYQKVIIPGAQLAAEGAICIWNSHPIYKTCVDDALRPSKANDRYDEEKQEICLARCMTDGTREAECVGDTMTCK